MSAVQASILAVEDDPRTAALLRATLAAGGYRLAVAATLAEARAWLEGQRPDLVLLDIGLPDGSGLDLARELRHAPETALVPILVTSARVLADDLAAAREAGSNVFLAKPLSPSALLDAVVSALDNTAAAPLTELGSTTTTQHALPRDHGHAPARPD